MKTRVGRAIFAGAIAALVATAANVSRPVFAQAPACKPAVVLPVSTVHIGADAQQFTFDIGGLGQTTYSCNWAPVTSDATWLTTGFVYFAPGGIIGFFGNIPAVVAQNATGISRTGHLQFSNGMGGITVIQDAAPCVVGIPPTVQVSRSGGTVDVPVQVTSADCAWELSVEGPSAAWLQDAGPAASTTSGRRRAVGPNTASFTVESNVNGSGPRSGQWRIGGVKVTINQDPPLCVFSMTPTTATVPAGGGSGTVSLAGTGTDCSYTATASAGVAMTSGASGGAPATIGYTVGPTTSQTAASASITVGGASLQIMQSAPAITTDAPTAGGPYAPGGVVLSQYRPSAGAPVTSGPALVRLTNAETPTAGWSATPDQPWLTVSPSSGSTPASLRLSVDPAQAALLPRGYSTATVSVAPAIASQGIRRINVTMFVGDPANTRAPVGSFDTPGTSQTQSGAIPVTGWALDDIGIQKVTVSRAAVTGEPAGAEIYIGDAVRVRGARPDAAAIVRRDSSDGVYRLYPDAPLGGWGYMLLSNVLPSGGTGSFTFFADAFDVEGRRTRLGTRTVAIDNAAATRPFGTIDLPAQGETVSGTILNRGWVLTPAGKAVPLDGSTIKVYIDGVLLSPVTSYNLPRPDVKAFFPGLANSDGPEARLSIDTTTLSNGVHTIAWGVIDDAGVPEGIGSRYFTVQNGAASLTQARSARARAAVTVDALPALGTDVWSRAGVDEQGWAVRVETGADGSRTVHAVQGQRLEIFLDPTLRAGCGTYDGHLLTGDVAGPLPVGASLETDRGIFRWQPGAEFAGNFAFVFVQRGCDGVERRIPISVAIRAAVAGGAR